MTKTTEFPLIISPNLGCPEIVSLEELGKGKTIPLIVACQCGEFVSPLKELFEGAFYLRPSDGASANILLNIVDEPKEIVEWNLLSEFPEMGATKEIINSELHYKVFGEETRYWKIGVSIKGDYNTLLRENGGRCLPTLFDLVFVDKSKNCEKVNYHSIQFVLNFKKDLNFIHLTDLHLAKRNDEILDEVLKEKSKRCRKDIETTYINFNDKLREFIRIANDMADRGELDFVVITGDLVDFAFHGWDDEPNVAENNWKTFINIITGAGKEELKGNLGLKVATFTSTGNHDWRLHPYDPKTYLRKTGIYEDGLSIFNEKFGLHYDELIHYDYKAFDSIEYSEDDWTKLSRGVRSDAFKKLNFGAFADKKMQRLRKNLSILFTSKFAPWVLRVMTAGGVVAWYETYAAWVIGVLVLWALSEIGWTLSDVGRNHIKKVICKLFDIYIYLPLHAEAKALHHYLKHINPYFDYAFRIGNHSFIVMDTGADFFVRQFMEDKTIKDINKLSLEDNILGGSPDSMAFDPEQNYYNWSQIVWLEKVLSVPDNKNVEGDKRSFIFLHAPPINPSKDDRWSDLWESRRQKPGWIAKDECNLTYGSINYYLSQFYYLCMGYRESELIGENVEPNHKKVDLVFSGHAHRNIEFRLEKEWVEADKKHNVRIYSDVYSQQLETANNLETWWDEHKPVVVQTAACGLRGKSDEYPPYFRKITVDGTGQITEFRVRSSGEVIEFYGGDK
ncbi:MAG: metallophosphoesterase [Euryarchaeota archaeon]|nr:metallophosphoesterase [Euryarchaeota archaeon]